MTSTEANFSFTTKIDGDLFTVRGDNIAEFEANVDAASHGIGAKLKNLAKVANTTAMLNDTLGATPVDPSPQYDQSQYQQSAPPAQEENTWGQAPTNNTWGQPAQSGGWGQPQGGAPAGGGEAWRSDPSIQPPHLQPPMTPFGPALYKGGVAKSTGRPYRMWVDPRPYSQVKDLPKEQKFSQFIRDNEL